MKFTLLLEILFDLLREEKLTAPYLAEKYDLSTRTVYRYVDLLANVVPLQIKQGRNGGISLADSYKLPMGFMTKEEYDAAIEALILAYSQCPEERFLAAKHKLSSQKKTENASFDLSTDSDSILVYDGISVEHSLLQKIRLIEQSIREKNVLDIRYFSCKTELTQCKIEPHLLICSQHVWYVYAFCHTCRDFRLFRLGRLYAAHKTEERFQKRPFDLADIPFPGQATTKTVHLRGEINESVLDEAQDLFGIEHIRLTTDKKWRVDVILPDSPQLVKQLLGFGTQIKILSPKTLQQKLLSFAQELLLLYR